MEGSEGQYTLSLQAHSSLTHEELRREPQLISPEPVWGILHLFREDQKKSFGKATDFECDSLFVPNPNMSTIQILLDGLNNKKCAGRKK